MTLNFPKIAFLSLFSILILNSCAGGLPGGDARKNPPDPKERVKKNLESGKGFRLDNAFGGKKGGDFEFASSNELWRASLDILDFIPLVSANYSGGIIITDWYSTDENSNDSIKISIRFLTNEIRSDALSIKVFNKKCLPGSNCVTSEKQGNIITELKSKILKTAALYAAEKKLKDFKPYKGEQKTKDF